MSRHPANSDHRVHTAQVHIAIVGGGYSGAATAIHLLRDADLAQLGAGGEVAITIYEPHARLGAGVAYSPADRVCRINVAAGRMLLFADEPGLFDQWLRQGDRLADDPEATVPSGQIYPGRAQFAAFLDELVRDTAARTPHVRFAHRQDRVEGIAREAEGYRLALADGTSAEADIVVLAVGHPRPGLPGTLREIAGHRKLVADPWADNALDVVDDDDRVLIVGTGLTMGDILASLRRRGHRAPVAAISRRGLTPRPRIEGVEAFGEVASQAAQGVVAVLRSIRRQIAAAEAQGRSWADVLEAVRTENGAIWAAWTLDQRRRFLRHLRPFWDVHRFQSAPQIYGLVEQERASGRLSLFAASIVSAAPPRGSQGPFTLALRRRGSKVPEIHTFDAVVNCTGLPAGSLLSDNAAVASLKAAGLVRADPLGIGIDVDRSGRPRTDDPQAHDPHAHEAKTTSDLFVVGPTVRGSLGEVSGAPELSVFAQAITPDIAATARRIAQERTPDAALTPQAPAP